MPLDYTSLENAIARLNEGIKTYQKYALDEELQETVRDSLVQRYEFTYELAVKQLAKTLRDQGYAKFKADHENKKVLFRTALNAGYINNFDKWNHFNRTRNVTSHEYDEAPVENESYLEMVLDFYNEVQVLLKNMKEIEL
jgi:nucleotidyltransferase substrate binding protein (TIGR01987 family)